MEASEVRQATIARLVELARSGAAAFADAEQARRDLDAAILPLLERYSDAVHRQSAARRSFYATLGAIEPGELEQAGADLRGVLVNLTERSRPHDRTTHLYTTTLVRFTRRCERRRCAGWAAPYRLMSTLSAYQRGTKPMDKLLETLQAYRAGQAGADAVRGAFDDAGWDSTDINLLLDNAAYAPIGLPTGADMAEQFLRRQARERRRQRNPLMR